MAGQPTITVICVPRCGHARAILALLYRRRLPFQERPLTVADADHVIEAYHVYGSPLLLVNGELIAGQRQIMSRIESLAALR